MYVEWIHSSLYPTNRDEQLGPTLLPMLTTLKDFIVKFPYNARSDWLKQRALSEIRERVDGIKLVSKYLLRNLDKFDPNYKHPLCDSDKININELLVSIKYGS